MRGGWPWPSGDDDGLVVRRARRQFAGAQSNPGSFFRHHPWSVVHQRPAVAACGRGLPLPGSVGARAVLLHRVQRETLWPQRTRPVMRYAYKHPGGLQCRVMALSGWKFASWWWWTWTWFMAVLFLQAKKKKKKRINVLAELVSGYTLQVFSCFSCQVEQLRKDKFVRKGLKRIEGKVK